MKYIMVIEEGDTSFGAFFPDALGCVAAGESFGETVSLGREALEFHFEETRELPAARTLAGLADCGELNDINIKALVWVDIEG